MAFTRALLVCSTKNKARVSKPGALLLECSRLDWQFKPHARLWRILLPPFLNLFLHYPFVWGGGSTSALIGSTFYRQATRAANNFTHRR